MTPDTIQRLDVMFAEFPVMRSAETPSVHEIDAAVVEIGIPFPNDYREFLTRYGGAVVGAYPIYGLRAAEVMSRSRWSVIDVTMEVKRSGYEGVEDWVIFSEDLSGNPIGMDKHGRVWISDHDFGGASALALSFEDYIRVRCLKIK